MSAGAPTVTQGESPAWPLSGKSVNMLVREISEKGVKFLQNPRTEKQEKGGIFQYIWKSRNRGLLKCCSGKHIDGYFTEKRAAHYQTNQRKGIFFTHNLREKGTSRTFLDKHACNFNQEWPHRGRGWQNHQIQRQSRFFGNLLTLVSLTACFEACFWLSFKALCTGLSQNLLNISPVNNCFNQHDLLLPAAKR